MTYCTKKITKSFIGKHSISTVRNMKTYNKENFQFSLLPTDWNSVLLSDVNEAWHILRNIVICFR